MKLNFVLIALVVLFFGAATAQEPAVSDASKAADSEEQKTLKDAAPEGLSKLMEKFKLERRIDITSSFDDGTLAAKAMTLEPLLSDAPPPAAGVPVVTIDPKAFAAMAAKWTTDDEGAEIQPSGKLAIFVCWVNPAAANLRGRQITRTAVESTWEHHGIVDFVDWGKCTPESKGIRIQIADERPWSIYGNLSEKESPSMLLNFTFNDASMAGCKSKADLCIWSIAVHEFGHALLFIHEQDRIDTPAWCSKKHQGVKPEDWLKPEMLTKWDEVSVMDYCFDIYSERVQLSDCDIAAYHKIYGAPASPPWVPRCKAKL